MSKLFRFLHQNAFAGHRAHRDRDLLQALQSELRYEKTSNPFQGHPKGYLGDFVLDWDAPQSQDVVLRKKHGPREEIAVSALLGPHEFDGEVLLPRPSLMKVCITKPGLSPVLQFDCGVVGEGDGSDFAIRNAYYLPRPSSLGASNYRGPLFSSLDPQLRKAFKEFLIARGINQELVNFLQLHLYEKERGQYMNWLQKMETIVVKNVE